MVVLKKIFSQLAFIFILFVILELISIKLFPEYSQNQKYKKLTNSNKKNLSIIQKGKYQHFELSTKLPKAQKMFYETNFLLNSIDSRLDRT